MEMEFGNDTEEMSIDKLYSNQNVIKTGFTPPKKQKIEIDPIPDNWY